MSKRRAIEKEKEEEQVMEMTEEVEDLEEMVDETLELSAVFVKLTHEKALVSKRDAEGQKYTGAEKCYVMKLKIKKIAYDKDGNTKEGCGDPWMGMSISSLDENAFKPFEGLEMGDEVIVSLTPVR